MEWIWSIFHLFHKFQEFHATRGRITAQNIKRQGRLLLKFTLLVNKLKTTELVCPVSLSRH